MISISATIDDLSIVIVTVVICVVLRQFPVKAFRSVSGPSGLHTIVLVAVILSCKTAPTVSTKSFYIHWNTSNSIFSSHLHPHSDHVIPVNQGNMQSDYDQVNIICPVYGAGSPEGDTEKYIIYNVSKEEYENCRITNPNPRIIAVCDKPNKLMYYTITFRPFTPQPGGLEFPPGLDYYFISTSSKDDLHRRIGGRCATHHMKVVFRVCCANQTTPRTLPPTLTTKMPPAPPPPPYARPTTRSRPHNTVNVFRGVTDSFAAAVVTTRSPGPRKSAAPEYPRYHHPNDVIQNEELSKGSSSSADSSVANPTLFFVPLKHKLLEAIIAASLVLIVILR